MSREVVCIICGAEYSPFPLWKLREQYPDGREYVQVICKGCFERIKDGWRPERPARILHVYKIEPFDELTFKKTITYLTEDNEGSTIGM